MDLLDALYGLFLAGAVYGGIRTDLRALHEKADYATQLAERAHERIHDLMLRNR